MKHLKIPIKKTGFFFLWLIAPICSFAQFTEQGIITFERQISLKRMIQTEGTNTWMKQFIDKMPQFLTAEFSLSFNQGTCSYRFEKEHEEDRFSWVSGSNLASKNQVWSNLHTGEYIAQKQVYEKKFLIRDSLSSFQWKIEDEVRSIAGYPCRKAVTRICDSVVVVAFYAPQIMSNGGPESFHGLPGMILGLAIPRLYTTWFATQVILTSPEAGDMTPPQKGEKVNKASFQAEIRKAVEDWERTGAKVIWKTTL